MSHADDAHPDPLKLPQDDLFGAMPLGDEGGVEGSPQPGEPDALTAEPAADETAAEPSDGKKKKRDKNDKKEKKAKEKKPKVKAEKKKKEPREKKPARPKTARTPGPPLLTMISRASPYTVMLAVALGSLVIAASTLALYLSQYGFKTHP